MFTATVMQRYDAAYDQCGSCGFLRIRDVRWLDEAYGKAICSADTGLVARNLLIADRLMGLCSALSTANGPYLDYGGGLGLLVRLMRDRGFDFWWRDEYASNELARGFEYDGTVGRCIAVTAFEVLEHVERPVEFVEAALAAGESDTLIFTTELFAGAAPPLDWWYYAREEGQHIAFFRRDSLEALARRLGLRFLTSEGFHVLTRSELSGATLARSIGRFGRRWAKVRNRRTSLTTPDSEAIQHRIAARPA